ncbi:hypothetical protein GCM10023107_20360 [Actinoplanes octamycinicus]|nr:hypothetical protein Aoc01nite_90490 [Actinoplanes octamycinicus]
MITRRVGKAFAAGSAVRGSREQDSARQHRHEEEQAEKDHLAAPGQPQGRSDVSRATGDDHDKTPLSDTRSIERPYDGLSEREYENPVLTSDTPVKPRTDV